MIYELRDVTDDERYYTLGVFNSVQEAMKPIKSATKDFPLSDYNYTEETEVLAIYRIPFGFMQMPVKVFEIKRENVYCDETDTIRWKGKVTLDNRYKKD